MHALSKYSSFDAIKISPCKTRRYEHNNQRGDRMNILYNFFAREVEFDSGLRLFGTLHIAISAFFLILYALLIFFRKYLRKFGHFKIICRTMAAVLFMNMLIHYTGRIAIGEWHFSEDLPLHICFAANFFMMYILWTDNKHNLFSVIYYFTLIGPLPAAVFPDLSRTWSGYLFWQFIISHHVMLLFSLYCAFVLEYETSLKHAAYAFISGNVYVAAMSVFNTVFSTNYIMLGELPKQLYLIFPFLYNLPAFAWLELAGLSALISAYAMWAIIEKRPPLKEQQAHGNRII